MDVIKDLKGDNQNAFGELYKKHFGVVNRYILNNSGTTEDAEDVFQDTMLVIVEKLRQDDFQLRASLRTYIMAIAKNVWLNRLKSAGKYRNIEEHLNNEAFYEELNGYIDQEMSYWDKLQNYMHKITTHCQGLLHDMFFKEKSVEQIQEEYGYSNKHSLQNQKYKCVEQIRKVKEGEEQKSKI